MMESEYSKTPQSADFRTEQNFTTDCEIRRLRNPQIASVIVCSKWDRMVYNTVLTAEKRGPQIAGAQIAGAQIAGAQIAGVYCTIIKILSDIENIFMIHKGLNCLESWYIS
jgi:hypothetical protein